MSKSTLVPTFIPKECKKGPWDTRLVYGVVFTPRARREIYEAICTAAGFDDDEYSTMSMFTLSMQVHDAIRNKYEMLGAYSDDVDVQLCNDLGIDWRQFEHNVPKQPIDAFLTLANRRFATLKLPTNETQWTVQRGRFADLWHSWVESECARLGCLERHHHDCGERYNRPSFWELALQLEQIRSGKAKLIAALDAKPRARAVKVANDELARISARAKVI